MIFKLYFLKQTDKLQDFTSELSTQNEKLNSKIQALRNVLSSSKLSVITVVQYLGQVRLKSEYSSASRNDSSIFSASSTRTGSSCSNCHFHGNLPNDNVEYGENLYMYGDTTKTIIFDGLKELDDENLSETILNCIIDISVQLIPSAACFIRNHHRYGSL